MATTIDVGRRAESRACRYLRLRGWRIVARNWTAPGGELDIVASRWKTLLVVEVRQRGDGAPLASIDHDKWRRVRRTALTLIKSFRLQQYRLRYDVIGIDGAGRLVHRRDIFAGGQPGD